MYVKLQVDIQMCNKSFVKNFVFKSDLRIFFLFFFLPFPKPTLFTASSRSYQDASYGQSSPSGDSCPLEPVGM